MDDPVIRKKYGNNDRPDFKFLFTCSRSRRLAGVRILFLIQPDPEKLSLEAATSLG